MKQLYITIFGLAAFIFTLSLNFKHAKNDYGIVDNKLHLEVLAQSNTSGGGSTSGGGTSGGGTSGGGTSGGDTSGGDTSGGDTSGGDTSGGDTSGGDTSGGSNNDGRNIYYYEHLLGAPKTCTLYVYIKAGAETHTSDSELSLGVDYTKTTKPGMKEDCPNKGNGCTVYSCHVTNNTGGN